MATYVAKAIISWGCAWVAARYMQIQPEPLIRLIVFCVLFLLVTKYADKLLKPTDLPIPTRSRPVVLLVLALFSFALSLSIVLGFHIVIDGHPSNGRIDDNYISHYSWFDLASLLVIWLTSFVLTVAAFSLLAKVTFRITKSKKQKAGTSYRFSRLFAVLALVIFIMWIPYLLSYWPALVLSDSTWSIIQALGWDGLNNHHPILYTLFVKVCLGLGTAFGIGTTGGLVIYSILQMTSLSLCLSFSLCWVCKWTRIRPAIAIGCAIVFGGSPYFATYSIAMWKDPFFSMALLLLTLQLGNFALATSKGAGAHFNAPLLGLFMLATCFTRNNGIYICLLVLLGLFIAMLMRKTPHCERNFGRQALIAGFASIMLVSAVTGPLYDYMGIEQTPKAESYGLFLNQMSRVAALDGKMSNDDRQYLDDLLPMEEYASAYCPTKADAIKWHKSFNTEGLDEGFLSHWLSLGLKNPKLYFEAWELETFGFWTINVPLINGSASNISMGGDPMNTTDLESYIETMREADVNFDNKLGKGRDWFALNEWSLPLGWIFWFVLFIAAYLFLTKQGQWLLVLLPALGLYATLFVASPMYYWPRYGAFAHFGIPIFAALPFLSATSGGAHKMNAA